MDITSFIEFLSYEINAVSKRKNLVPEVRSTAHSIVCFVGSAQVPRGSTFRVHASVLSLDSPAFSRMLAKANLATAESVVLAFRLGGFPSSDADAGFAMLRCLVGSAGADGLS